MRDLLSKITLGVIKKIGCDGAVKNCNLIKLCWTIKVLPTKKKIAQIQQEMKVNPAFSLSIVELEERAAVSGYVLQMDDMTPTQIVAAYNGHNQSVCMLGNLFIVAIRKAFNENSEPFIYQEDKGREDIFGGAK